MLGGGVGTFLYLISKHTHTKKINSTNSTVVNDYMAGSQFTKFSYHPQCISQKDGDSIATKKLHVKVESH